MIQFSLNLKSKKHFMNYHLEAHLQIRKNLYQLLNSTPLNLLTKIPNGFNNNLFWNIAHCVATQQLLHYYLSDLPIQIQITWIDSYKKGTFAPLKIEQENVDDLKFILLETNKILRKDLNMDLFMEYKTYTTSFGMDLHSIKEAIIFNNIHESLHLGYAMAQSRALEL